MKPMKLDIQMFAVPITNFNGVELTNIYYNGTEISKMYCNRTLVFEKGPTVYKRRIMVGDNLDNKTLYFDFPDNYIPTTTGTMGYSFISGDWSSFWEQPYGDDPMDTEIMISGMGLSKIIYDPASPSKKLTNIDIKNEEIGEIYRIDDTNASYRHCYIEDSNIRPIRAKDVINENTKIYFTWPDNLNPTNGAGQTDAIINFNVVFHIVYKYDSFNNKFNIEAVSWLSSEEKVVLFDQELDINKSYLDLNEFVEGAAISGTISFEGGTLPIEVLNGILVDETTLTSSGPEPTDPTLIFPTNIRRIQIGDNLFQKYIYSDFPWKFDNTIQGGENLTIIDTAGHDNSFYIILLPESGNSIIKSVNKDVEYCLYWGESNPDNAIFGKRKFFIGKNDTDTNKNNYIVTSLYLDGASWGKGAYRCLYIEDPNIRPVQVGDKIIEGTQLYFNFPDNPDSWLTGKYSCDVIKCGDKTIMYYVTEQPVSRATSTISSISLESNDMYAFDLNTLEISKNLSSYIIKFYYQDAVSYVDDKFQQYILVDTITLGT